MLGHKEWRFIVYVVPLWNVAGARGCVWMYVVFFLLSFLTWVSCARFSFLSAFFDARLSSFPFIHSPFPRCSSFFPTAFLIPNKKPKQLTFVYIKNRVSRRKGTLLGRLSFLLVILLILANTLITTLLTTASMANYPGGHALSLVHSLYPRSLHTITKREFLFHFFLP